MTGILFDEAGITCRNPSLGILGGFGAFGILVIFDKRPRRAIEDLAAVGDFQLNPGRCNTHSVGPHLAIRLLGDENAGLCLTVKLFQVDSDRPVEVKDFRANRLACGIADTYPGQAKRIFQRAIDQQISKRVFQPLAKADRLAVKNVRPHVTRKCHEVVEHFAFEPASILHPDHDRCQNTFKITRRREEIGRANLAQIMLHRIAALGAGNAETRPAGLSDREYEISDPCHRQIGQNGIIGTQAVKITRGL